MSCCTFLRKTCEAHRTPPNNAPVKPHIIASCPVKYNPGTSVSGLSLAVSYKLKSDIITIHPAYHNHYNILLTYLIITMKYYIVKILLPLETFLFWYDPSHKFRHEAMPSNMNL